MKGEGKSTENAAVMVIYMLHWILANHYNWEKLHNFKLTAIFLICTPATLEIPSDTALINICFSTNTNKITVYLFVKVRLWTWIKKHFWTVLKNPKRVQRHMHDSNWKILICRRHQANWVPYLEWSFLMKVPPCYSSFTLFTSQVIWEHGKQGSDRSRV